MKHFIEFFYQQ